MPVIAAVADSHFPKYADMFRRALENFDFSDVDLLVLAGDMVYRGRAPEYSRILSMVREKYEGPIIAVYGNEEYMGLEDAIRKICGDEVTWLDDSYTVLSIEGERVGIVGSRGALDEPTTWQSKHIPNIRELYSARIAKIEEMLREARRKSDYAILVTHYAPICDTLRGERQSIWKQLGSKRLADVVKRVGPDAVIHGHAHRSRVPEASIGRARVYNVSLPAIGRIARIELKRGGLLEFL